MSIFSTNEAGALKERWVGKMLKDTYEGNVLLTVLGSPMKAGGRLHHFTLFGGGASTGADYGTASGLVQAPQYLDGEVQVALNYGFGKVSNVAAKAAKGSENGVVDLFAQAASDARARCAAVVNHKMLVSRGFGEVSYVKSHTGTTGTVTITLQNPRDSRLYRVGDQIEMKDDPATASLRTGYVTITKIAPGVLTGTCGGSADLSAGGGADGAAIGFKGDMANSTARTGIIGLKGWLTRTSGDLSSFCNLDRTINEDLMAGSYAPLGNLSVRDAIDQLSDLVTSYNAAGNMVCLVSTANYRQLQQDLGDHCPIGNFSGSFPKETNINFGSIKFTTSSGKTVEVIGTPSLDKEVFMIDPDYVAPVCPDAEMITTDGGEDGWISLEPAGEDAMRFKCVFQGNLVVTAPLLQAAGLFS